MKRILPLSLCLALAGLFSGCPPERYCSSASGGCWNPSQGELDAGDKTDSGEAKDAGKLTDTTIHGKAEITWQTALGNVQRTVDLSAATIQALIPEGDGYAVKSGTGTAQGDWSINDVPPGEYLLRVPDLRYENLPPAYVVTERREIDLGAEMDGRPDAGVATVDPTILSLNLTGLEPNEDKDLEVSSLNLGGLGIYETISKSGDSLQYDWNLYGDTLGYLLDPAFKDDITVSQFADLELTPELKGEVLVRRATIDAPAPIPGKSVPVAIELSKLTEVKPTIDWNPALFASFESQIVGKANSNSLQLNLIANSSKTGRFSATLGSFLSRGTASARIEVPLHQPTDTTLHQNISFIWTKRLQLPGSNAATNVNGWVEANDLLGRPMAPLVGPAGQVKIDNQDAFQDITISAQPLVEWQAPTIGNAKGYEVRFYELSINANGATERSSYFEATLITPHTKIRVPPGVLKSGKTYYMRLLAYTAANMNIASHPFATQEAPKGEARFASGIITVK